MRPVILASSSPRRRELLKTTGLSFGAARPDIDEAPLPSETADQYVVRLSREKALAASLNGLPADALIITADTTVVLDAAIIGKPADPDEARRMLRQLRDRPHLVHTGLSVRDAASGAISTDIITTSVYMRNYTDDEIEAYIASGEPFDKAGGYAVQDARFNPVARLDGCYTNVMGLPLCAACRLLREHGIHAPTPPPCNPHNLPCRAATALRR